MAVLCVFLTAACGYDYKDKRIPNYLILLTAVFGMVWRLWNGTPLDMMLYFGEGIMVAAALYPFFKIGAVGAGDVKLLGVTAGYLPSEKVLFFLFFSLLIAAIFSFLKMWKENSFKERLDYLREYLKNTAACGSWQPYPKRGGDKKASGICLSGPVLAGVLLYLGGVY